MIINSKVTLMVKYYFCIFTYSNLFYHVIILDLDFQVLMSMVLRNQSAMFLSSRCAFWLGWCAQWRFIFFAWSVLFFMAMLFVVFFKPFWRQSFVILILIWCVLFKLWCMRSPNSKTQILERLSNILNTILAVII